MKTGIKGGKCPMKSWKENDKVSPKNIYPKYLRKAIITFDIDKMETWGIYEVTPEFFALCDFVYIWNREIQKFLPNALNLLYKKMN